MFDTFFNQMRDGAPLIGSDMMGSTHYQKLRGIVEGAWFSRWTSWKAPKAPKIDITTLDLDAIKAKAKTYKGNPHILFVENAADMVVIQHPDVHAVIASDKLQSRDEDIKFKYEALMALEHETEALILDKIMDKFRSTLTDEQIALLEFDPDRFEDKTGLLAEQSNMYSDALNFQEFVANMQLGKLSERITLNNPEEHCFVTLLDDNGFKEKYTTKTVRDEERYLRELFIQVTGKSPQRTNMFIHGTGIFGKKTTDNFHLDHHEISEEDRMAQAWGGVKPESEYVMLRNYIGPPTQYIGESDPDFTQDDLDAWESNPRSFDHDKIAKEHKAKRVQRHNIVLFKTTELGMSFEDAVVKEHPAFVHRGPTIYPGQARMALAYTSLA